MTDGAKNDHNSADTTAGDNADKNSNGAVPTTAEAPIAIHPLRVADLPNRKPTQFELTPPAKQLAAFAADLDLLALKKLRFTGTLRPLGKSDWQLTAELGATVVQPCVVTLDPVTTRIDEKIERVFLADKSLFATDDTEEEIEMDADDSREPLGDIIDPGHVMLEALALALPLYPRHADADLGEQVFTEPGKQAMRDEDTKPFAGLAALRDQLDKPKD